VAITISDVRDIEGKVKRDFETLNNGLADKSKLSKANLTASDRESVRQSFFDGVHHDGKQGGRETAAKLRPDSRARTQQFVELKSLKKQESEYEHNLLNMQQFEKECDFYDKVCKDMKQNQQEFDGAEILACAGREGRGMWICGRLYGRIYPPGSVGGNHVYCFFTSVDFESRMNPFAKATQEIHYHSPPNAMPRRTVAAGTTTPPPTAESRTRARSRRGGTAW
jgi:hypothetical protein